MECCWESSCMSPIFNRIQWWLLMKLMNGPYTPISSSHWSRMYAKKDHKWKPSFHQPPLKPKSFLNILMERPSSESQAEDSQSTSTTLLIPNRTISKQQLSLSSKSTSLKMRGISCASWQANNRFNKRLKASTTEWKDSGGRWRNL